MIKPANICSVIDNNNFQSAVVIDAQKIAHRFTKFIRPVFVQSISVYLGSRCSEVFISRKKPFSALSAIKRVFFNYVTQELIIL